MSTEFIFLSLEDILHIHEQEIKLAGGEPSIRDLEGIKACVDSPKSSFGGEYLQDLFGMATTYITCITMRHPFVDGNKRTALASSLTFLYVNGYSINESHDEELADLVVDFITKKITKADIENHLKTNSIAR